MFEALNPANALEAITGYLNAGGPVVTFIMITAFVMWMLIAERLIYFSSARHHLIQQKRDQWGKRTDHSSWFAHAVREQLISELNMENQRYLWGIKVLILVTPLLGLLGTVTGMIEVFQVITSTGSSNARLMAGGISKATVPTMTGLAVSLSGVLLINYLERLGNRSNALLEDSLLIQDNTATRVQQGAV